MNPLPAYCTEHLAAMGDFYSQPQKRGFLSRHYTSLLAATYNFLINDTDRVLEIGCGSGDLLALLRGGKKCGIDLSETLIAEGRLKHPPIDFQTGAAEFLTPPESPFDVIILSDVLNQAADVEALLRQLHKFSHPGTCLLINIHNTLWRPLLDFGRTLGLARKVPHGSWLSRRDVINLCTLADWEVFKSFGRILLPMPVPLVSRLLNRWLAPLANWACLAVFLVARRANLHRLEPDVVSVVVPARNEAGNIAHVLERTPRLGKQTELIFIEGHSRDSTWDAIQALPDEFPNGCIVKLRQSGKGKGNAVIEAFRRATGDIVMILDADLTVPPEDLPKFVEVLASGKADFANGVRLVYPMDENAMRFANLCANKGFGLIFSWLLGQHIKDTLCGTKAMWRDDYLRLDANRAYFGDFDPFGDFDLLFGADKLRLKIMDVPVRYKQRTYGETNIHRWRHGFLLLRMVLFAARRLKFVRLPA
jgi:SAM-dependent methyltransferase